MYDNGFAIRQDLLDKYGLSAPKTYDDLLNVLTIFKQNDPKSAPLTTKWGIGTFEWGMQFAFNTCGYDLNGWDKDNGKFVVSALTPGYKAMVTWLADCYKAGALDPTVFSISSDQVMQNLSTGVSTSAFIYWDNLKTINAAGKKSVSPDFNMVALPPLSGPNGAWNTNNARVVDSFEITTTGGKKSYFPTILKFMDWMYTDDGIATVVWGKEGTTYTTNADGTRSYMPVIADDPNGANLAAPKNFGLATTSLLFAWPDDFMTLRMPNADIQAMNAQIIANKQIWPIPPAVQLSSDQSDALTSIQSTAQDYVTQELANFILGKEDVSTGWDAFTKQLTDMGVQQIADTYNQAYQAQAN